MLNRSQAEQINALTYKKLMDTGDQSKSYKILAEAQGKAYVVTEEEYTDLFKRCQSFIGSEGYVVELKGTDANQYETLSSFYRISMLVVSDQDKPVLLAFDNPEVKAQLSDLGLDSEAEGQVSTTLDENAATIRRIASALKNADIVELTSALGRGAIDVATHQATTTALSVAVILAAAWFGPAYVAAGVDFLYPYVYAVIWGVPSKLSLSYWLIYYPSKVHAVAWAYKNASTIINVSYLLFGMLYKGYQNFRSTDLKEEIQGKLETIAETLEAHPKQPDKSAENISKEQITEKDKRPAVEQEISGNDTSREVEEQISEEKSGEVSTKLSKSKEDIK